ncbi:hypothetical protein [Arthrobacter sp. NA-172]|uniref:hypothetical protein n=1 Tax=Arthrobacter sp. NA-172 TaxID=3367524 RepID=UPI0037544530
MPVEPSLTVLLTAGVGAALSASYYTLVRVLEQQWPWFGAFLGLTSSPDAYSKASPETAAVPANPALGAAAPVVNPFIPAETVTVNTPADPPAAVVIPEPVAPVAVQAPLEAPAPVADPAPEQAVPVPVPTV